LKRVSQKGKLTRLVVVGLKAIKDAADTVCCSCH